jgi:molecular chaperone GrpE
MAEQRESDRGAEPQEAAAAPTAEERIAKLEEDLRRKSEEAAVNLDRYLRAVAEGDNFKKRIQREKSESIRFANETLLRDLLQVIDSLELAVEHADTGGNGKSVVEGVQLTLRLFRDVLERHGVKEIGDPTGGVFDPSTQEAAEIQADEGVAPNTVIKTRTKGYRYNDRLLRPSRVVVAAGGAPGGDGRNPGENGGLE